MAKKAIGGGKKSYDWVFLLPVMVVAAIVPLIVRLTKVYAEKDIVGLYASSGGAIVDVFSYHKAMALIWMGIITLFFMVAYAVQKEKGFLFKFKNTESIGIGVFVLFSLLSAIIGGMPTSWMGYPYRFEGVWVTFAYAILFYCVVLVADEEKTLRFLTFSICFSAFFICLIGLPQYFGYDFFKTDAGKMYMVPESLSAYRDSLSFNFGAGTIYTTLFNPNNVGSMMSMLAILFPVLGAFAQKIWVKILYFVLGAAAIFTLLGCNSRAGYVGAFCGFVVAAVLIVVACRKEKKLFVSAMAQFLAVVIVCVAFWGTVVGIRDLSFESMTDSGIEAIPEESDVAEKVIDVQTYETSALVCTNAGNLTFDFTPDRVSDMVIITDESGKTLEYTANDDGTITLNDSRFSAMQILADSKAARITLGSDLPFTLVYDTSRGMEVVLPDARRVKTQNDVDYVSILDRYGSMGSGRGYIWSRSIPLIKKTLIFGHGPDTYAAFYPQNELGAKIKYLGLMYILVDKPHNTYLQYAINNGCVALVGFLVCCVTVLIKAFGAANQGAKSGKHLYTGYVIAFCGAVVAYLGSGMFNDSIVSVAPIFFILLGGTVAASRLARKAASEDEGQTK